MEEVNETLPESDKAEIASNEVAASELDSNIPKEIDDAINMIPDKTQARVVKSMLSMQFGTFASSPENAISKKITSEHITQYLTDSGIAMRESFKERRYDKIFKIIIFVTALIFIGFLVVSLKDIPDVMEKIIYLIIGLGTGVVGGYGFGRHKGTEEE